MLTKGCPVAHILAKQIAGAYGGQLFVALEHASGLGAFTGARGADEDHAGGLSETHGMRSVCVLQIGQGIPRRRISSECDRSRERRWAVGGGDGSGELRWEARAPVSVNYSAHIVQDSQKKDVGERDCRE